jgi:MFS family permease
LILFILSLLSVIASTLSPLLAANTLTLSLFFRRPFTDVALLTGWQLFGVGVGGFLFVPSSRVWGKRHAFLLGNIILIFSSAWGGASGRNYKSWLVARIFQGFGLAPFEALVNAAVGDLYFVHERGKRMALTNFCVFGGSFLTPVIVGKMSHDIGWKWTFYFVAIFSAMMLPIMFFFVPETAYRRDDRLNTDTDVTIGSHRLSSRPVDPEANETTKSGSGNPEPEKNDPSANGKGVPPEKISFVKSLRIFNGRKTDESYWRLLLRPFPLFLHPGVLWVCVVSSLFD